VIDPALSSDLFGAESVVLVNPRGRSSRAGPVADAGLTGRKIVADSYGPSVSHAAVAFSGKDASKVDRRPRTPARHLARAVVDFGFACSCRVDLAYAIGVPRPVSVNIAIEGEDDLGDFVEINQGPLVELLRPGAIAERLGLRRPIFQPTASYGISAGPTSACRGRTPPCSCPCSGGTRAAGQGRGRASPTDRLREGRLPCLRIPWN